MISRRILLATAPVILAVPALAQRRQPARAAEASPAPAASPAATPLGPLDVFAREALVIDADTGAVLLEKDADKPMPPSSMSKLMTTYVVFSLLKEGRLTMEQKLPVSERAWRMQGSKMFVHVGDSVAVSDLLRGVIVQSGNDACIVFEEAIGGSESGFAEILNDTARRIGLRDSTFRNSTGWPHPEHRMTCRDLATLARRLILDFPEYYPIYAEKSFRFADITQENRNPIVQRGLGDGLKTGHTEEAGYGLVASSLRNGRRVISVCNGWSSMRQRAEESTRLIEWAFREFENVTLFTAGDVVDEAPVWLGERRTVPLVGGHALVMTMPRAWRRTATVKVMYNGPIPAPVRRGDRIGELVLSGNGVPAMRVPLFAGADVDQLGLPGRALAVVTNFFGG